MKILFFKSPVMIWDNIIDELKNEFPEVQFIPHSKITDKDIAEAEAFVGVTSSKNIEKAENLKIIFINFTGPDMLPFDLVRKKGVRLSNTHGNARYVAERALAMTMTFYGRMMLFHDDLKAGKWHGIWGGDGTDDSWESLYGKSCAIIGTGEIGKWIAHYLKPFNCKITGFKKRPFSEKIKNFDKITTDLTEALEGSEIIFIALPLTDETRDLFTPGILSTMKGKFIINVGRGEVIDEEGLYNSLKNGILKGAALDVWYSYPDFGDNGNPSKYPFHELENVLFSPHVGGSIVEASEVNLNQTVENIKAYLKTGNPVFEVDISTRY
ncbi:2-hydroxyacid dehydrogenase [Thermodesulfobacteriota bacterium]